MDKLVADEGLLGLVPRVLAVQGLVSDCGGCLRLLQLLLLLLSCENLTLVLNLSLFLLLKQEQVLLLGCM